MPEAVIVVVAAAATAAVPAVVEAVVLVVVAHPPSQTAGCPVNHRSRAHRPLLPPRHLHRRSSENLPALRKARAAIRAPAMRPALPHPPRC
uniref:Putative secreted peptide n=1 Tax=Anopheles braziliensis TaxID=58242 RepID=A0A2M3ZSH9_9DIPT